MELIGLSLFLYSLHCVKSFEILYDTSFNHLTKIFLEEISENNLKQRASIETKWILQPIDHFGHNVQHWWMRYFERLDFFQCNGPVYIFLGGEGTANKIFLTSGIVYELAQETGGAMFMIEHRYYGKSKPFFHLNTYNLKWLSSKQALADTARVIRFIKSDPKFERSKIVVIGGSYAGNLAAWMRLKYPELVDAAIASSAPVLAKVDFYEYLEKVTENYERYGTPNCLANIKAMFKRYREMFKSPQGIEQLNREYNLCNDCDLNDVKNQWIFFWKNTFMDISQSMGPKIIREHCIDLEHFQKLAFPMVTKQPQFWFTKYKNNCTSVNYKVYINQAYKDRDMYPWIYQVCTEFGYFATTSSTFQPFGHVLPKLFHLETCKDLYGSDFDEKRVVEGVTKTNEFYGGSRPNVTRVVFVNGDVDPWSTLSVLGTLSDEAPAVVIPGATHCADVTINPKSTVQVKEASRYIRKIVKKWIGIENEE